MNCVIEIARTAGRNYITPEDVTDALMSNNPETVRLAVLEILGKQTDFGVEDYSLCAFIAWSGEVD